MNQRNKNTIITENKALIEAIDDDDLNKLESVATLENQTNILSVDQFSGTPIVYAAHKGQFRVISFLWLQFINKAHNFMDQFQLGKTLLELLKKGFIFRDNSKEFLQLLIQHNANLRDADEDGNTILHVLFMQLPNITSDKLGQYKEIVEFLLAGSNGLLLDLKNKANDLPLHVLCGLKETETVILVLEQVLNYSTLDQLNARNKLEQGLIPLNLAVNLKSSEVVKMLIECAHRLKKLYESTSCFQDTVQDNALFASIAADQQDDHLDLIKSLAIKHNLMTPHYPFASIQYSVRLSKKTVFDFLLKEIFFKEKEVIRNKPEIQAMLGDLIFDMMMDHVFTRNPDELLRWLNQLFECGAVLRADLRNAFHNDNVLHQFCRIDFVVDGYLDVLRLLLAHMNVKLFMAALTGQKHPLHDLVNNKGSASLPILQELLVFTFQKHFSCKDRAGFTLSHHLQGNRNRELKEKFQEELSYRQQCIKMGIEEGKSGKWRILMEWFLTEPPFAQLPFELLKLIFDYCCAPDVHSSRGDFRFNLNVSPFDSTVKLGFYSENELKPLSNNASFKYIHYVGLACSDFYYGVSFRTFHSIKLFSEMNSVLMNQELRLAEKERLIQFSIQQFLNKKAGTKKSNTLKLLLHYGLIARKPKVNASIVSANTTSSSSSSVLSTTASMVTTTTQASSASLMLSQNSLFAEENEDGFVVVEITPDPNTLAAQYKICKF